MSRNVNRVREIGVGASVDVNAALSANVDAAVAAAVGLRLMGWATKESNGTPAVATFTIVHGATGAGGTALVPVELAANESKDGWYGPNGLAADSGISIDHIAGVMDVELFYKTLT